MDSLPALGTAISAIVRPTFDVYEPLLLQQAAQIKSTKRETHSYGPHPRQKLDLYSPSSENDAHASRLLVFMYGGGFVTGDKIIGGKFDGLVYANIGHYFAETLQSKVAIVDYRLIDHGAKYPSGGEDLSLAIEWLVSRVTTGSITPLSLFLMGNSAGGVHVATFLLAPQFAKLRNSLIKPDAQAVAKLKGAVLIAVPYHFEHAHPSRSGTLSSYFGDNVREHCPLGLLESFTEDLNGLGVLIARGELDPEDEILSPHADFVAQWEKRDPTNGGLQMLQMRGHNHISPVLGVGTGLQQEEEWARAVVDFIVAHSD